MRINTLLCSIILAGLNVARKHRLKGMFFGPFPILGRELCLGMMTEGRYFINKNTFFPIEHASVCEYNYKSSDLQAYFALPVLFHLSVCLCMIKGSTEKESMSAVLASHVNTGSVRD
jgi:hypothetical protein